MCGVAGFSLGPNERVNAKRLSKALLLDIESRGTDATGFAFLDGVGQFQVHKTDLDATTFVKRRLCIPKGTRTAIMHTRFATQGLPIVNDNNHPIATGTVVGVHNGVIYNDDSLFDSIETIVGHPVRIAQVDSEAPFAALGWTNEPVKDVLESIQGSATLAWMDKLSPNPDTLHLARVSSSPLIVGETEGGSVIFASTDTAIIDACADTGMKLEKLRVIEEGTYLQVLHGDIHTVSTFTPPYYYTSAWNSYRTRRSGYHFLDDLDSYEWSAPKDNRAPAQRLFVVGGNGATNERLAAEEPDFGAGTDSDEERYEEWLRQNDAAIDRALSRDEDPRLTKFMEAPRFNTFYLDVSAAMPMPTESEYLTDKRHIEREWNIERWFNEFRTTNEEARTKTANCLKAAVRPGDYVSTDLDGLRVDGSVVYVPETFPGGMYGLRVWVPNKRRTDKWEVILVERRHHEFEVAVATGSVKFTPDDDTDNVVTAFEAALSGEDR